MTPERVDEIFKETDSYVLELASEPGALGPQYFQNIISVCRNYLNKVSLIISEINRERLDVSSELRKLEALYALDYDDKLANDVCVKNLASVDDRKAAVGYALRGQQTEINKLKDQMHALDSVYKVVSHRNRELHATMTAIKDQRRLMQTEVATGAFYGDERTPKSAEGMGLDDDFSEEALANMLSDIPPDGEGASPKEDKVVEVVQEKGNKASSVKVEESDVLEFLASPEESLPVQSIVVPDSASTTKGSSINKDEEGVEDALSFLENL